MQIAGIWKIPGILTQLFSVSYSFILWIVFVCFVSFVVVFFLIPPTFRNIG